MDGDDTETGQNMENLQHAVIDEPEQTLAEEVKAEEKDLAFSLPPPQMQQTVYDDGGADVDMTFTTPPNRTQSKLLSVSASGTESEGFDQNDNSQSSIELPSTSRQTRKRRRKLPYSPTQPERNQKLQHQKIKKEEVVEVAANGQIKHQEEMEKRICTIWNLINTLEPPPFKRSSIDVSDNEMTFLGFDEDKKKINTDDLQIHLETLVPKHVEHEDEIVATEPINRSAVKATQSPTSLAKSLPRAEVKLEKLPTSIKEEPKPHIVADNGNELHANVTNNTVLPDDLFYKLLENTTTDNVLYRKPFEYGWKRELVWRAQPEGTRDRGDVYFFSPFGKKLRTRNEVIPHLQKTGLTIENFSFERVVLGFGEEFETVRYTRPAQRYATSSSTVATRTVVTPKPGKRASKPKVPKGATPPPEGWTPAVALKVNDAALYETGDSGGILAQNNTVRSSAGSSSAPKFSSGGSSGSNSSRYSRKPSSAAISAELHATISTDLNNRFTLAIKPCSENCERAPGQYPQLKCEKCLCLYHQQCSFIGGELAGDIVQQQQNLCKACKDSSLLNAVNALNPVPTPISNNNNNNNNKNAQLLVVQSQNVQQLKQPEQIQIPTPPLPPSPPKRAQVTQSIAVLKSRKYIMLSKIKTDKSSDYVKNDLKKIADGLRGLNSKLSPTSSLSSTSASTMESPERRAPAAAAPPPSNAVVQKILVEEEEKYCSTFTDLSRGYQAIVRIFKYLKIQDLTRAARVCKFWNIVAKDDNLWQSVRMKNSKVCNWAGFARALRRGETRHLDLRKMLTTSTGSSDEMWKNFERHIATVCSLEAIDLCRCSANVVQRLFTSNCNLRVINALTLNDSVNLTDANKLICIEELRLRPHEPLPLIGNLEPLADLENLQHLSLTNISDLNFKSLKTLAQLTQLRSLELGECGEFDYTFAEIVMPSLVNLQRLRLENGTNSACDTLAIIEAVQAMPQLTQLELINFDVKDGFAQKLSLCTNIEKLLLIPTYLTQSATTNNIVLNAVLLVKDTLKVFTWCVTSELLRVTALYMNQCESGSNKEKLQDERIPVLKPVPGAQLLLNENNGDGKKETCNDDPYELIEIISLDKLKEILAQNCKGMKYKIVKVPHASVCKQQLVE